MKFLNESCFNNIQKYNLNEKPIKIDNIKDENIKEYVKGMKLNITNYKTHDVYYLDSVKSNKSLINDIFVAVKLVNLSVCNIFNSFITIIKFKLLDLFKLNYMMLFIYSLNLNRLG